MRYVQMGVGGKGKVFSPEGHQGNAEKKQTGNRPGAWQGEMGVSNGGVACGGTRGRLEGLEALLGTCQVLQAMGMPSAGVC
jgi:hypothetical protein